MSIFNYWQALRRLTPMEIAIALFGLSGLLLLVAAADLLFRHLLGLPKDVALYLSILSVIVLLTILVQCRWITGRATSTSVEQTEQEDG